MITRHGVLVVSLPRNSGSPEVGSHLGQIKSIFFTTEYGRRRFGRVATVYVLISLVLVRISEISA